MVEYVKKAKKYHDETAIARKIGLALNRCEGTLVDIKYANLFLGLLVENES